MKWGVVAAVACGGAIGSVARYFVAQVQNPSWTGFPYGIFLVNVSGGFIMGVLVELMALRFSVSPEVRAFLTTGILGGYTTFSSFSWQTLALAQNGQFLSAVANVLISVVVCLVGVWLGAALAGWLNQVR